MSDIINDRERCFIYASFIGEMLEAIQERMDELSASTELSEFDQGRQLAFLR